jgi:hypothetical protein
MRLDNIQLKTSRNKPTKKTLQIIKEIESGFQVSRISAIRAVIILERFAYHKPFKALKILDVLLDGFGVEYIASSNDTCFDYYGIEYINTGDTYSTTILYDRDKDKMFLCSWGDIVENRMNFYI